SDLCPSDLAPASGPFAATAGDRSIRAVVHAGAPGGHHALPRYRDAGVATPEFDAARGGDLAGGLLRTLLPASRVGEAGDGSPVFAFADGAGAAARGDREADGAGRIAARFGVG